MMNTEKMRHQLHRQSWMHRVQIHVILPRTHAETTSHDVYRVRFVEQGDALRDRVDLICEACGVIVQTESAPRDRRPGKVDETYYLTWRWPPEEATVRSSEGRGDAR